MLSRDNQLSWPYSSQCSSIASLQLDQLPVVEPLCAWANPLTNHTVTVPPLSAKPRTLQTPINPYPGDTTQQEQVTAFPMQTWGQEKHSRVTVPAAYIGVSRSGRFRWRAQFCTGGRNLHLGTFATQEEAAVSPRLHTAAHERILPSFGLTLAHTLPTARMGSRSDEREGGPRTHKLRHQRLPPCPA